MHSSDTPSEEPLGLLAARVGRLIHGHRVAQGLSVAELAARSELSRTILARIERGEGNPSIGTLWRISQALRLPLGELLVDAPAPRTRVVRAGEGETMEDPSGLAGRLLHAEARERRTELYALELPRGAVRDSPAHLPGVEELVVVTAGRLRAGPQDAPESLGAGDALWYAADVPHAYAAEGRAACRFLNWLSYPPAGA